MKNKKRILSIILGLLAVSLGYFAWSKWASATRIALVNFPNYQVSNMALSNEDSFIKFEEVSLDQLDKLKNYDFVLAWGMGIKIDENQRNTIIQTAEKIPTHFVSVTSPENDIKQSERISNQKKVEQLSFQTETKKNFQRFCSICPKIHRWQKILR